MKWVVKMVDVTVCSMVVLSADSRVAYWAVYWADSMAVPLAVDWVVHTVGC